MSDESTACQPRTLSRQGNVRVDLCGCGHLHVTLGPVTVRLGRDQYLVFCNTLLAAARDLPETSTTAVH